MTLVHITLIEAFSPNFLKLRTYTVDRQMRIYCTNDVHVYVKVDLSLNTTATSTSCMLWTGKLNKGRWSGN